MKRLLLDLASCRHQDIAARQCREGCQHLLPKPNQTWKGPVLRQISRPAIKQKSKKRKEYGKMRGLTNSNLRLTGGDFEKNDLWSHYSENVASH